MDEKLTRALFLFWRLRPGGESSTFHFSGEEMWRDSDILPGPSAADIGYNTTAESGVCNGPGGLNICRHSPHNWIVTGWFLKINVFCVFRQQYNPLVCWPLAVGDQTEFSHNNLQDPVLIRNLLCFLSNFLSVLPTETNRGVRTAIRH